MTEFSKFLWPKEGMTDRELCEVLLFHLTEAWGDLATAAQDIRPFNPGAGSYFEAKARNARRAVHDYKDFRTKQANPGWSADTEGA